MIHYKDLNGEIHSLSSSEYDYLLPVSCVEITQAEYDALLVPTATEQLDIDRNALKSVRNTALSNIKHDYGDGRIIQLRPSDISNIDLAIKRGSEQEWVLDDKASTLTAILTPTELQAALDSGVAQAVVIWDQYMMGLKAL